MSAGNEPAYPAPEQIGPNDYYRYAEPGLTKRELIAAMAMQGLLANPAVVNQDSSEEHIYRSSVYHADALLAALSEAKPSQEVGRG